MAYGVQKTEGSTLLVKCFKGRAIAEFEIRLEVQFGDRITYRLFDAQQSSNDTFIDAIAKIIAANPGINKGDLIAKAGISKRQAERILLAARRPWRIVQGSKNASLFYMNSDLSTDQDD
jgi:hypothetical protein